MIKRILLNTLIIITGATLLVVAIIIKFSHLIGMGFLIYSAIGYPDRIIPAIIGVLLILTYFLFGKDD